MGKDEEVLEALQVAWKRHPKSLDLMLEKNIARVLSQREMFKKEIGVESREGLFMV